MTVIKLFSKKDKVKVVNSEGKSSTDLFENVAIQSKKTYFKNEPKYKLNSN